MATAKEILSALNDSGGPLDLDGLTKKCIIVKLKQTYGEHISSETIEEQAENIIRNAESSIYLDIQTKLAEINALIESAPSLVSNLTAQIATIPASVVGMAAPAAAPMILSVRSQAASLKMVFRNALSKAASLGIDIPGIDPLITAYKAVSKLI